MQNLHILDDNPLITRRLSGAITEVHRPPWKWLASTLLDAFLSLAKTKGRFVTPTMTPFLEANRRCLRRLLFLMLPSPPTPFQAPVKTDKAVPRRCVLLQL